LAEASDSKSECCGFKSHLGHVWYDHSMGYKDKERQREFQRTWIAERKAEFFKGKRCVRCDSADRLELDHVDPTIKVSHSVWSWSESRRTVELLKCQVLCHTCHWEKTKDDFGWRLEHGTVVGYKNYACRCARCTKANTDYIRERRARARMDSTVQ
jgi:hypothetical protein